MANRIQPHRIVVMGVSGSGKSMIGRMLAATLGLDFVDGDDLHPAANVRKMHSGLPLDDADRWPWLEEVGQALCRPTGLVVACSALKRAYRDHIRMRGGRSVFFVYLGGSQSLIGRRLASRKGHFMPARLLHSQFAALEPPGDDERALRLSVRLAPQKIVGAIEADLRRRSEEV